MRDLDTIHAEEARAHAAHIDHCPAIPRGPWGCGHFAPTDPGIVPVPPPAVGGILTLYVGADNRTGARIGPATVARILAGFGLSGWTSADAAGFWQGTPEASTVLTVLLPAPLPADAPALAGRIGSALARAHRQDSVAWSLAPAAVGFADPRDAGPSAA